MSFNLATILRESARTRPDKPAVLVEGARLGYAELDALSDRFAAGLLARGIAPGDSVALQLPNVPQFVIAYFGILKAGAVAVPMNVLLKAGEVGYILSDSGARLLITWAGVAEEAAKGAADAGISDIVVLTTPGIPQPGFGRPFETLLAPLAGPAPLHQTDPGDTAVIIYTSGTTGRPKGRAPAARRAAGGGGADRARQGAHRLLQVPHGHHRLLASARAHRARHPFIRDTTRTSPSRGDPVPIRIEI